MWFEGSASGQAVIRGRASAWWLFLLLVCSQGCGYKVASSSRLSPQLGTLAVAPFENETRTFEVEQILTRSLRRAFVERSGYRLVNDISQADGVLRGTVSRLSANPVTFGQATFGSTFLVTVVLRLELLERATNKVLFRADNHTFREQYVINVDAENFFSELNPALGRIAEDMAASVVATILEGF